MAKSKKMKKFEISIFSACFTTFLLIYFSFPSFAFDADFGGYIKNLQAAVFIEPDDAWQIGNVWNMRLNTRIFLSDQITWTMGGNTIFIYSNGMDYFTEHEAGRYAEIEARDISLGYVGNSYLAGTFIDRNYFEYMGDSISVSIGYQRINWGMNLIWNPNDIFNAYSFYDFDYEERPGILSLRCRLYTSPLSSLDAVISADDIYGALYRTNAKGFDFQFLGGYGDDEIILGTGFAGQLFKGGFRAELTMFIDQEDTFDYIGAVTGDYTFKNGLYLHLGFLYNTYGLKENALLNKLDPVYDNPVKNLSAGRSLFMLEVSRIFTPLLTGTVTCFFNILDNSFFLSPAIVYSIFEDLELIFISQLNFGGSLDEYSGDLGKAFFFRARWSF